MDRPDEVRRIVNFKRLQLTDFKIDIPRVAKKKVLAAALEESGGHTLSPPAARGFSKATSTFFGMHRHLARLVDFLTGATHAITYMPGLHR